jgi:hypothetical protein
MLWEIEILAEIKQVFSDRKSRQILSGQEQNEIKRNQNPFREQLVSSYAKWAEHHSVSSHNSFAPAYKKFWHCIIDTKAFINAQ